MEQRKIRSYESHVVKPRHRYVPEQIILTDANRDAHTISIRSDATRYLQAKNFMDTMKRHRSDLTVNQMKMLKSRALNGDVTGAFAELNGLLFG